jgi:putative DNA primase/helicase
MTIILEVQMSDIPQNPGAHDPCTNLANAHRLVNHFGSHLLFVKGIGWHTWSPPWRHDELGAERVAHGLGKIIAQEAADMAQWVAAASNKAEREELESEMNRRFKWASSSESAQNVAASLSMARPLLSCEAGAMDAAVDLLGLPGGVLDLSTGDHREHRQNDRLTRVAGCDYNPSAKCETWQRFLGEIMGGDAELLDYLQRLFGYALSGRRGEHILPIFYGSGANGKSTLLATMQRVLGEYSSTAAPGLLIASGGTDHPTGLAALQGRRLVVASETGEAGRLNEELVKALTGGDRITARRMRQDFYQFDPSHILVLQTNHKPRVTGSDEGIWRRLRLVPFAVTVAADKRDVRLPEKLQAELPGILAWAVEGWRKYQAEGFSTPAAVTAATSEYRDASDQIGAFVADCCEVGSHHTAAAGDLYRSYSTWCDEAGERPRMQREFGMRLGERGFEASKGTGGIRRWRGLMIAGGEAPGGASGASGSGFGLIARETLSHIRLYRNVRH